MPSMNARVTRLEKKIVRLEQKLKDQKAAHQSDMKEVVAWIKAEAKWSKEVTKMLRMIDWDALATDYGSGPGSNPPQTPPDWPMT